MTQHRNIFSSPLTPLSSQLSTSETPDYDAVQKKALDTLRRSFYPDIIVSDLETDQLMKLHWPTLDEDETIPIPCERYNEHRLTHQTHRIGCHCNILGGPKALAKVFLVNKPGQWTGWFVMGCGSYRTHPTGGCGFFAPLGRKDSDIDDREFFKPRVNGDLAPLHYYPQHGAEPSPPLQIISKPPCFQAPQVLQVGGPGSSLFGALGSTFEAQPDFGAHGPSRYRTPVRKLPALRMKEEEAGPTGPMPNISFDDPIFVVPATGYSTTAYHRDGSGVLTGPLAATAATASPLSRVNTATAIPPPRVKATTPPPPRIKASRFSPYPEAFESASGATNATAVETKPKGKAKAPARVNFHPFSLYTRFVAHDGRGISQRELGEIVFTCPECRGSFAFWVKQAHETISKSFVIDLTIDDDD